MNGYTILSVNMNAVFDGNYAVNIHQMGVCRSWTDGDAHCELEVFLPFQSYISSITIV
jgi:hypothetical protein